jgi:hypothetical protein
MKPLFFVTTLIMFLVAACSSETVLGPENDPQPQTAAARCSVINGQLC